MKFIIQIDFIAFIHRCFQHSSKYETQQYFYRNMKIDKSIMQQYGLKPEEFETTMLAYRPNTTNTKALIVEAGIISNKDPDPSIKYQSPGVDMMNRWVKEAVEELFIMD